MFERAALIHYHEIGLKGRNRGTFERRLAANISSVVGQITGAHVEHISSRLLVRAEDPSRIHELCERIAMLPGVSYVGAAWVTSRLQHDMDRAALLAIEEAGEFGSFAVEARRSNTDHTMSSMEMNRHIGQVIVDATHKRVDLDTPDVLCRVEVVQGEVYTYTARHDGIGGLPVGTAGTVVSLLSAGIDSPVATWRAMKRGAVVVAVHFSGRPHTSDLSERFAAEICASLERYGGLARLYVVPFGDLQKEISLLAPPGLRVLLYRRLMVRVAEAIAGIEGGMALVTGESLGQVASQTLENIVAVDQAATMPVLRPLIGLDKLEIITEARRIGTYEISIQEHADCCTLFMPKRPATHATVDEVLEGERDLDLERMVADALAGATWRDYACPAYRPPGRKRTSASKRRSEG